MLPGVLDSVLVRFLFIWVNGLLKIDWMVIVLNLDIGAAIGGGLVHAIF